MVTVGWQRGTHDEELQQATGTARSRLTSALQELVDLGFVEATAPPHSPNRRYRAIRL